MEKTVQSNWCMTGIVSEPAVADMPAKPSHYRSARPNAQESEPATRRCVRNVHAAGEPSKRDSHVLMVGVTLIIAALALFLNVGQISQAAYDKGIGTGAAQAKKADYTQAYDKGVADGYEKAKQEWQLSQ